MLLVHRGQYPRVILCYWSIMVSLPGLFCVTGPSWSVSPGHSVLLVLNCLEETDFGLFKVWIDLQDLLKVSLGFFKKACRVNVHFRDAQ